MKKINKLISVLLVALMLVTSAPLSGLIGLELPKLSLSAKAAYSGTKYGNTGIYYSVSSGEVTITDADESIVTADIPERIDGYPVTSIGAQAFYNCTNLIDITIPSSVVSIGKYAFSWVSIENVYITDLTAWCKIDFAGYNSNPMNNGANLYLNGKLVTNLVIPNSIKSLNYTFGGCTSITSVIIPKSVTSIDNSAFGNCTNLKSVSIPNSVTYIGVYTFWGCSSLNSIVIPDSVTSIGTCAFEETGYYDNSDNWEQGVLYIGNHLIKCSYLCESLTIRSGTKSIAGEAFAKCDRIQKIIIPDSVKVVGDYAFEGCASLQSVTIGNSVTSIGDYAFRSCKNIKSVTIPNSVTSIEDCAFIGCTSLQSVTIGNSVTRIGWDAFDDCESLKNVYITDLESWCKIDFEYGYSNPLVYASKLYLNGEPITNLVIPDGITEVKDCRFYNCTSITAVTIPNSVTSIESFAFEDCTSLKSVTIPKGVTSIGGSAFYNCTSLKSVTIPKSVTSIGYESFGYMYNSKTDKEELIPGFTIKGAKGSDAERYAKENKIKFVEVAGTTTPAQVKSLKASAKTSSSVTLTWAKVSGTSGYEVYKYSSSSKKYTKIGTTTSNTFKVSELLSSTKYMFAVRAYSTSGGKNVYGKMSNLLTVTTSKQGKPAQVAKPKVTKITATTLTLSWIKVGGADVKYYVFSYNAKTKKYTNLGSTTSNTFTAKKLKAGTKYTLVVQSYGTKSKSWGKISSSVSTATAPVAPSITVTAGKKQATVKWNKVTGATNYTVYFATSKNGKYKSAGTTTKTSLTVSKLSSGKTYYFKVIANEKLGNATIKSAYSAVKSAKVK